MKISVDGQEILTLSETQKKVIANDISREQLDDDLKRRINWVIVHKYQQCFDRLKKEWDSQLKDAGIKAIPLDNEEYASLVFAQPSYKSRADRDAMALIEKE